MKICIVGAGAIGGWFAGHVGQHLGAEVELSALARGATLAALRQHGGLRMDLISGERIQVPLRASDKPEDLGQPDLIVLAVKGPALASVAPAVKALLGPQTRVLVAMNGVPWWFFQGLPGEAEGLRLESVSRALSRLARCGIIEFNERGRRQISIPSMAALNQFIQNSAGHLVPTLQ